VGGVRLFSSLEYDQKGCVGQHFAKKKTPAKKRPNKFERRVGGVSGASEEARLRFPGEKKDT